MKKKIVILEVSSNVPQELSMRYLLWIPTPFPIAHPNVQSGWQGASPDEVKELQDGTTIEEIYSKPFPASSSIDDIKNYLINHYNSRVAYFESIAKPGQFYGVFYDGSGWSG